MTGGRFRLTSNVLASITLDPQGTASTSTLRDASVAISVASAFNLAYGTGAGQFNLLVAQQRTLAASANEELNLFDGTLKGYYGEATGFQTIKGIAVGLIVNPGTSVTASSVTIGNASATVHQLWFGADTHTADVFKNGPWFQQGDPTGKTVDNSNKLVKVLNNDGSNSATYFILAVGRSN